MCIVRQGCWADRSSCSQRRRRTFQSSGRSPASRVRTADFGRWLPLAALLLVAGCATTLPDGSRIERLPANAPVSAPALTPQQAERLAQLNAQVLAEQDAALASEARAEAWRRAQQQLYFDLYYGPGWWGWHDRWGHRHPRWSFGLGWYGPWPY